MQTHFDSHTTKQQRRRPSEEEEENCSLTKSLEINTHTQLLLHSHTHPYVEQNSLWK